MQSHTDKPVSQKVKIISLVEVIVPGLASEGFFAGYYLIRGTNHEGNWPREDLGEQEFLAERKSSAVP